MRLAFFQTRRDARKRHVIIVTFSRGALLQAYGYAADGFYLFHAKVRTNFESERGHHVPVIPSATKIRRRESNYMPPTDLRNRSRLS